MAWSGGTYTRTNGQFSGPLVWTSDFQANIKILSARHDTHDFDLANGINACLNKNGQNTPTADMPWGGHKITNLQADTVSTSAATVGQTITAASVNGSTNVLTLTRAAGNVTVDLSSIVIGANTSDFARYSNSTNPFTGSATFAGTLGAFGTFTLVEDSQGSGSSWAWEAADPALLTLRPSVGGIQFNFQRSVSDPAGGYMSIGGYKVWHAGNLDPTGFMKSTDSPTITGFWTFTGGLTVGGISVTLPRQQIYQASGGGTWTQQFSSTSFSITPSSITAPLTYVASTSYSAGATLAVNGQEVWNKGNAPILSTTPTGGHDGDIAFVRTGGSIGVWANNAGTWVKIAS